MALLKVMCWALIFIIRNINKTKRELIMHRNVPLLAVKSPNKLKYLTLEGRKWKTAEEVDTQF